MYIFCRLYYVGTRWGRRGISRSSARILVYLDYPVRRLAVVYVLGTRGEHVNSTQKSPTWFQNQTWDLTTVNILTQKNWSSSAASQYFQSMCSSCSTGPTTIQQRQARGDTSTVRNIPSLPVFEKLNCNNCSTVRCCQGS